MKIALVSPLYERVPPINYGGTERIVAYLCDALVDLGHRVTLYASADSRTKARLIAGAPRSLRTDPTVVDSLSHHMVMLERVYRDRSDYDVVHFHLDYLHFSYCRNVGLPHLTTLHGRLDLPDLVPLYREFSEMPVSSISNSQRSPLPWLNWQGTVYHGLPEKLLTLGNGDGGYLAFLGRICPEKGLERAIEISARARMPLRVAAKVDRVDQEYFQTIISPLLRSNPHVEFVGEIDEKTKQRFLGEARALLFPINWPEPFGLVMIEAMACGTPNISFSAGSVPEVMADPASGFIVESVDEAVSAVAQIATFSRKKCRKHFEKHFLAERMASQYVEIYQKISEGRIETREEPLGRYYPTEGPVLRSSDLFAG